MTIHYHGTPITPTSVILSIAGNNFCVSHAAPNQVEICHKIGQSVLLDCGAFSKHTKGKATDWPSYYAWCDKWLDYATTWAIIPDEIAAGSQEQDYLIREWPHGDRGAPVWHSSEPLDRLYRLCDEWPKVCIGSTDEHWKVLSPAWISRIDEAFNGLAKRHRRMPWIHMLRGMQLATREWPFASVDSTDIARNHHRCQNNAPAMASRWNSANCPATWSFRTPHPDLFSG